MIKKIFLFFFVVGIALLILNIFGFFMSLRNADIYTETEVLFKDDIIFSHKEVKGGIIRKAHESDREYVFRVNRAVNKGVAHYWKDEGIRKYNLRVPIWENYLLYFNYFNKKYEYSNYKKAIERGAGLCSQQAIIVTGILNDNGINAQIIGLDGHIVLTAEVENNIWHIVDPDYGIIMPYDISEIEKNPEIVRLYYQDIENQYRGDNGISADEIIKIYGKEGNYICQNGVVGYKGMKAYDEYLSYIYIWVIPFVIIIVSCICTRLFNTLKNKL
ncbi:MAG: hypothetical protein KAQ87_02240 [Candidatus Pacebacteria bacterium]|nr:hypothetical protein [Candidatus Paceibacterota bacterium]